MNNNFITGASYIIKGFSLILKPGLKRFVILPLVINITLFISLFYLAHHFFSEFNVWFENHLPHWLLWLSSVLWLIFLLSFFLIMIYTFVTVANLISSPFNSFLAEKIEWYLTGKIHEQSLLQACKDIPRIIGRQLAILGYYLPRAIFILILFMIPFIQLIAVFIWFLFNAWFMTLQYIDYPTDNHRIALHTVKIQLEQQRWLSWGFGISVLLISMVPILNFFIIPAAVAGATAMWVEQFNEKG